MSDFTPKTDNKPSAVIQKSRNGSSTSEAELAIQSKTTLEGTLSNWYKANSRPGIQAKLKVSEPDDPQEKEADKMALQVMTMPEPVTATPTVRKEELQREQEEEIQKQEENKEEVQLNTNKIEVIQRNEEEEIQKQGENEDQLDRSAEEKEEPIQKMDENEMVQTKQVDLKPFSSGHGFAFQRKEEEVKEEEINRQSITYYQNSSIQRSGRSPPAAEISYFSQSLESSKGKGNPLPDDTRSFMESRFNADFAGVRIHTDESSVQMNKEVHAQAFTHGNDIYFNSGKYSPSSSEGKTLLAHELTHTIQQCASSQVTPPNRAVEQPVSNSPPVQAKQESEKEEETLQPKADLSRKADSSLVSVQKKSSPLVQRGIFSSIAGAFSSAVEWVGDRLDDGKKWLLKKIQELIVKVPGYKALCVVLGKDPVTDEQVERNGKNFIDAAIDIIPGGSLLQRKLTELGILDKAGQFVETAIEKIKGLVGGIFSSFNAFWSTISLSDLKDVPGVFHRLENVFTSFINQIISFASDVGRSFLDFIKKALLIPLGTYIKTKTKFWDLLCIIIGKDPLTDEPKVVNGTNILNAVLGLSEWGVEQRKKMQETDTFSKVAAWIDKGISVFSKSYDELIAALSGIWNYVNIESLMDPVGTFNKIFNSFWIPISRVASFVIETGITILKIVKDVLFKWISKKAKDKKGYYLITVLIGKDPFTGGTVPRSTESIIKGFMMLSEGGEEQFTKMKESGAMDRATQKIDAAIATLGFSWEYVKGLFIHLWESFTWVDIVVPVMAFAKIIDTFTDPILRLINFVVTVLVALFEVILRMMGFPVDLVFKLLDNVKKAWKSIKANPSAFFINILKAIKQGFSQFFDRFLIHLVNGLIDWFFDQLKDVGVTRPPDLTLKSIINLVLQVLGISMEKIWEKLSAKIGADKVAKIRGALDKLEGIWKFIRDVQERGMSAIWEYIQEQLSNLWTIVLEAATKWIMEKIITQVTVKLLSMLDPTGIMAVVNSCIAIYKAIESFIQYFTQMLGIINSFVEGIIEIAEGNITKAANFLEKSMASAIPIVIGFLANQVGLGKIGKKIVEVIEKVQDIVDKALDWLIDKAVSLGTSFITSVKAGVASLTDWWKARKELTTKDGTNHSLYFEGTGNGAQLMIATTPMPVRAYVDKVKKDNKLKESDIQKPLATVDKIEAKEKETATTDDQKTKKANDTNTLITQLAAELAELPLEVSGQNSGPLYGGTYMGVFGTSATVAYQQAPFNSGSEPGVDHAVYDKINVRKKEGGSYYVKGHLLNDNLGGSGKTWSNLTPLNRDANKTHQLEFEDSVKIAVNGTKSRGVDTASLAKQGYMKGFSVTANYGRSEPASLTHLKTKDDLPPDFNPDWDIQTVKDLLEAEKMVPNSLTCNVTIKNKDDATEQKKPTVVVDNNINHGVLSYYQLGIKPKTAVKLSDLINLSAKTEKDMTDSFSSIKGIGSKEARKIYETFSRKGRITNGQLDIGVRLVELNTLNDDKKISSGEIAPASVPVI